MEESAQGSASARLIASQGSISSLYLNYVESLDITTSKNSHDAKGSAKCSSDFRNHAEVLTSSEFKFFLSSNVYDLRPDHWKTDFCLQKSNSFCSPSFGEERGREAWRDLL
jgi:hypothetical protein